MSEPVPMPQALAAAQALDDLVFPAVKLHPTSLGRIPGRIGFVMYLYYREQRGLEQRLTLLKIIHEIRAQVGEDNWGWWGSEATHKMYFDRKKKFDLSKQEQHLINPNKAFGVGMSSVDAGGDSLEEVSDNAQRFFFEVSANERNAHVGSLRFYAPASWAIRQPPEHSLVALFSRWATELKALHGVLGLGVGLPMQKLASIDRSYYFDLARAVKQYPGLICEAPLYMPAMAKGMTSINWQTYVHDEWLERIGGRAAVKAQCQPPVAAIELPHGLRVQAGPEPQIASDALEYYRRVARIFKPLRAPGGDRDFVNLEISTPENARDDEQLDRDSIAYLARFD